MGNLLEKINAMSGAELFAIGCRNPEGDIVRYGSAAFRKKETGTTLLFSREGLPKVTLRFREDGQFICETCRVSDIPGDLTLEWIEPFHPVFKSDGASVFLPKHEGMLIRQPEKNLIYKEPGWHNYLIYPGYEQMQFLAYFNGDDGFYFAAHDPAGGTKSLAAKYENGSVMLMLRIFCGCRPGESYESRFETVMTDFKGGWMEAASLYRDWVEHSGYSVPKGKMPNILADSPVVLIYPVRGDGDDRGEMTENEYFPYRNAMSAVCSLADRFESKVMPLLMHWEGTAPWAPPYVWPPFGGETSLAEFRDELHRKGHYLGVYCSGTAWTQTSSILKSYSRIKQFEEEHLESEMIRGPHGEIDAYICNGPENQRIGYDMCNSRERVQEIIVDEVKKLAVFGLDYAQFFDQNLGGASHPCWSGKHGHPPVPGAWQTVNMRKLLKKLNAVKGKMVLGAESAAAEPYIGELQFNDLRFNWECSRAIPVPAYEFIYHEYINNFMGNQCRAGQDFDNEKSPENLLWRTAFAFDSGNLLSVVLKDRGHIHWGWCMKWNEPEPEQSSIITLVKNLNNARKRWPQFLQYGRMMKPKMPVSGGKWMLHLQNGTAYEFDSFFHTFWRAPDGSEALIITNFLPKRQSVQFGTDSVEIEPLSAFVSLIK